MKIQNNSIYYFGVSEREAFPKCVTEASQFIPSLATWEQNRKKHLYEMSETDLLALQDRVFGVGGIVASILEEYHTKEMSLVVIEIMRRMIRYMKKQEIQEIRKLAVEAHNICGDIADVHHVEANIFLKEDPENGIVGEFLWMDEHGNPIDVGFFQGKELVKLEFVKGSTRVLTTKREDLALTKEWITRMDAMNNDLSLFLALDEIVEHGGLEEDEDAERYYALKQQMERTLFCVIYHRLDTTLKKDTHVIHVCENWEEYMLRIEDDMTQHPLVYMKPLENHPQYDRVLLFAEVVQDRDMIVHHNEVNEIIDITVEDDTVEMSVGGSYVPDYRKIDVKLLPSNQSMKCVCGGK